jgi:hypothetical protein
MAVTFEREDLAGSQSRWCPERDAIVVRRWITDRSRELGGGMRRVVRFARLAGIAGSGNYVRFLYDARIPSLRASHFRATLQEAYASGRLAEALVTVSSSGVTLHESAMCLAGTDSQTGFGIDFAQMPRVAALLDVLHNALGYAAVEDVLEPILVRAAPQVHADEVARALHAKFNAWLADRLDSPHHMRQAQMMRAFLAGRGPLTPDAIDDEAIVAFWTSLTAAPDASEAEGFRLFTSAARAMLRYRRALRDAAAYGALGSPLPLDDRLDHGTTEAALGQLAGTADAWESPLFPLAKGPASAVKWLTKRERQKLLNYLGGPHPDGEDEEPDVERQEGAGDDRGLAGGERFDLRFVRTLLRADAFGVAQAGIVARLRKRVPSAAAVADAMAPVTTNAYEACAASYAAVGDQLRLEALAALAALLEKGVPEALVLVGHLAGHDVGRRLLELAGVDAFYPRLDPDVEIDGGTPQQSDLDDGQRQSIASILQSVVRSKERVCDGAVVDLVAKAQAATARVNRMGFRRQDRVDPAVSAALRASVHAVVELLGELDRLLAALPSAAGPEAVAADRPRFEAAFRDMYRTSPSCT